MSNHSDGEQNLVDTDSVGVVTLPSAMEAAEIARLKNKRSVVKRRITTTLQKLKKTLETESTQHGAKAMIVGYGKNVTNYLAEAETLNEQLFTLVPENEQETVLNWYEEQLERVHDAKLVAEVCLEQRQEENTSVIGPRSGKSVNSSLSYSSSSGSAAIEARAKATAAQIKAKQLREEEQRRKEEFERHLDFKRKVEKAQEEAERARIEAEERRKTQEAKNEAMRLAAEAEILENITNNPENLVNRMGDFDAESPGKRSDQVPLLAMDNQQIPSQRLFPNVHNPSLVENVFPEQPNSVIPTLPPQQVVSFESKEDPCISSSRKVGSWINKLQDGVQNQAVEILGATTKLPNQSLPKLRLSLFDGDPLRWSDWASMFKSIVHDTNVSANAKMQHLQNSVTGTAKTAIEGYGYGGESYWQALKELESRFGKPSFVVKATLGKLRKANRLQEDKPHEVRNISDIVTTTVWTLKRFGYENDLAAQANMNLAESKLSNELKPKWKEHVKCNNLQSPTLVDFSHWLKDQAAIYDDCNMTKKPPGKSPHNFNRFGKNRSNDSSHNTIPDNHTLSGSISGNLGTDLCAMGDNQQHKLWDCPKFIAMNVDDRLREVKKLGLCFSCFGRRHWLNQCRSKKKCGVNSCTKLHHALLHSVLPAAPTVGHDSVDEHSNSSYMNCNTPVLLQVVPISVYGPKGYINTYGMLDTGSTCTLVTTKIANQVGLDGPRQNLTLNGIQESSILSSKRVTMQVSALNHGNSRYNIDGAVVVDRLNVPRRKVNLPEMKSKWPHLSDLELPVVDGSQVTVLIGSDAAEIIIPIETRIGPRGSPVAIRTKLGWTVTGRLPGYAQDCETVCFTRISSPIEDLHERVKSWWRTENFGCKYDNNTKRSMEDERVLEFLDQTTCKVNGHYEVGLLWKDQSVALPNNRNVAEHRLNLLEKRLRRDPKLAAAYEKTIQNDVEKGYIKKLSRAEVANPVSQQWYLPHHPVSNPHKPGKVRRVCDAAARFRGSSLNDHLVTGPDLLSSLVGVCMRFREEKIALAADIEAMFNQIAVPRNDQAVLRFLWVEPPDSKRVVYQYSCHIFGAKCSPTCANYALIRNARDNKVEFPDAAAVVERNFYMDDFFKSVESVRKALELHSQLVKLMELGHFRLTKWLSNAKEVIEKIPEAERSPSIKVVDDEIIMPVERALGIVWNTKSDCLVYSVQRRPLTNTRRKILSLIASLFDPLGFLAPFLVKAKMFLQEIWQLGIGWDDPLPQAFMKEWSQWQNDLENISEFAVPRFYRHIAEKPMNIQLHIFGDASERAFGSVAYFRFTYASGSVRCAFVTAKTRVAPQKRLSIPKLELQAAVLSVRMSDMVIREHDYVIDAVYFWSDSIVVLYWIHGASKRQPPFIANRIGEILDSTDPSQWHQCPGKLNPADDSSRGLSAAEITSNNRWMNGPAYLLLSEEMWPKKDLNLDTLKVNGDGTTEDKNPTDLWTCVATQDTPSFVELAKYSKLTKLLRVIAYVFRFVRNCRKLKVQRQSGPLLVDEVKDAKKVILKVAQLESFPQESAALQKGRSVSSKSKLISLSPFLDEDGIIRVGGRIGKAVNPFEARHPIVLGPQHELTRLVIMDYHIKLLHEGVNHVRNELRQQYWILRCRTTVRKFLHRCAFCKKRRVQPEPPKMAGLPSDRLQMAPAFSKVGVDYFGPLTVKYLRKREKRYGCLFTCLVTRGVHLEVAHSLETDSFIMCLQRFIARRGKPSVIYSDNGTNFVGASRELRENIDNWNQEKIANTLSQAEIQWVFNPPAAPHMGGVWERLVRSSKKALNAVLQNQIVTDEVLTTAMAEVESLINSRPLTEVSQDLNDLEALTPNHFILGRANANLPPGVFEDREISSRKRWRQSQVIVTHIWNRWLKEYLPSLMERKKWNQDMRNLKVGDLVLLVDYTTSRGSWPLGRVVKIFPGSDNVVRSAEVKTVFGVLKRPATKIALLEECPLN